MEWQRARSPEKVEQRKSEILAAAKELFANERYEEISLNSIAAKANFTKSNVYRYFSSREEIFLLIYSELVKEWSTAIVRYYRSLKVGIGVEKLADGLVKITARHEQFLTLSALIFISLEKNSSKEQLIAFKRLSIELAKAHQIELERLFPTITPEGVFSFLRTFQATSSVFWASANPNKELMSIYKDAEFRDIAPNFEKELSGALTSVMRGILTNTGQ